MILTVHNEFINCANFTGEDLGLIERYNCFIFDAVEFSVIEPQLLSRSKLITALVNSEMERSILCGGLCRVRDLRGSAKEAQASVDYDYDNPSQF